MKNNKIMKLFALLLVAVMLLSTVGCAGKGSSGKGEYTYNSYTTALGSNWNPHTWETSADDSMLGYVTMPFVTMQIKDSENGIYQ